MNKVSLYIIYPDMKTFYTGKIVGDIYYRNLKLGHSVLWSDREFGLNVEILDYLIKNNIKTIVYIDTSKVDNAYKISVKRFDELKVLKEFAFGKQYFVKVDAAIKLLKSPVVPYIKKSVYVTVKEDEKSTDTA